MVKLKAVAGSSSAAIGKSIGVAGLLIDRTSLISKRVEIYRALRQASQCLCGAHNIWLRVFYYILND